MVFLKLSHFVGRGCILFLVLPQLSDKGSSSGVWIFHSLVGGDSSQISIISTGFEAGFFTGFFVDGTKSQVFGVLSNWVEGRIPPVFFRGKFFVSNFAQKRGREVSGALTASGGTKPWTSRHLHNHHNPPKALKTPFWTICRHLWEMFTALWGLRTSQALGVSQLFEGEEISGMPC